MDILLGFLEPLLRFILIATLIFVVFFFIIKPLFDYLLLNKEIELKKRLLAESDELKVGDTDSSVSFESTESTKQDADDIVPSQNSHDSSAKDKLGKLAKSSPEKAGDLVKNWLHSE